MIQKLILKNFRNFENYEINFEKNINFIIGENGKGKTNILEAISLLSNNPLQEISFENLVKNNTNNMFISGFFEENIVSISFDKKEKKKKFIANSKSILRKKINSFSAKTIIFSPTTMNLFYFSPSSRRKFLDNIIENSFPKYKEILKKYENILKQRNKFLKAIRDGKEKKKNITFWNSQIINLSIIIYKYRKNLINFIKNNNSHLEKYFLDKNVKIKFLYESKINLENPELNQENFNKIIENEINNHFNKNFDLEILLGRTNIGPHLDDFDIKINSYKIVDFASRGEIKSVILALKFLEIDYLQKNTKEIPIILIDDFLSEIDDKHKELLISKLSNFQTIITSISDKFIIEKNISKKIFLK